MNDLIKKLAILICIILLADQVNAQKPSLNVKTDYAEWPTLGLAALSNDGKFAAFTYQNVPINSQTLIIVSTDSNWKLEIPNGSDIFTTRITEDSKTVIFTLPHDSMGIVSLGKSAIKYLHGISSFQVPENGDGKWIAYQKNDSTKTLVIENLHSGQNFFYLGVLNYKFYDMGNTLIVTKQIKRDDGIIQRISHINLKTRKEIIIWEGTEIAGTYFDERHKQLSFLAIHSTNPEPNIWLWKIGDKNAEMLTKCDISLGGENFKIKRIANFSNDGRRLFLILRKEIRNEKKLDNIAQLNVWNYKDLKLQTQQLEEIKEGIFDQEFLATINLKDDKITQITRDNETCLAIHNETAFIQNTYGDIGFGERKWRKKKENNLTLLSLVDGRKQFVPNGIISPNGTYIIFYDDAKDIYKYYNISKKNTRTIPRSLKSSGWKFGPRDVYYSDRGIAGWLSDSLVLIYDRFDIWKIDLAGKTSAINITNGYGARNEIIFNLVSQNTNQQLNPADTNILLLAFDPNKKNNGVFYANLMTKRDPKLLHFGQFLYDFPGIIGGRQPLKAKKAETYILCQSTAHESPNYFCTSDFKNYKKLSDLYPEKRFNWITSELITWKMKDGTSRNGILYKPENFDSSQKYPVIINYYERNSDRLHSFIKPASLSNGGQINIPMFASNGYLVFTPDIYYNIGSPGESALVSIETGVKSLFNLPYIDTNRLGLQGFSFGGFETNYIVTHSNIFSAACSAAGISNMISLYGSLREGGSFQGICEEGQIRMGKTLWESPEKYLENSPIMRVDKLTTPILIMHNVKDDAVPFSQSVEFFTALRRLNKKSWLLSYDDGKHGLRGKSAIDFNIRMFQFFDHYLKDEAAPKWMTEGIPAIRKGTDLGLEIDSNYKSNK
ncbi:alpha/beta hydrolase family protein [Olivibacter domesticus]|uniref:Dipeptidyl aminopeptidase/acylaminoacyl peptidase n=1 Tax=Olivibacter domesticus TaxID=407022 RepID=A0A1H7II99_OLID1|nr:prolyl oligopeptidase family serine peptidase [Olivibacter domesticus]SEK61582.1 Dipeptidyl aminopeptidase/acylaminoacyl peptidase [Olivibacter domesticus]